MRGFLFFERGWRCNSDWSGRTSECPAGGWAKATQSTAVSLHRLRTGCPKNSSTHNDLSWLYLEKILYFQNKSKRLLMKNYKTREVDNSVRHGHKTTTVDEYMTKDLVTFHPDTPLREVIHSLLENRITGAPVMNEKREVVGLIDDKDCLKLMFDSLYHNMPVRNKVAKDYMSNVMKSVQTHTDIMEAANLFLTTPYKRLLVLDENKNLMGQISRRDILQAIEDIEWGPK